MWVGGLKDLMDPQSKKSDLMHGLTSVAKAVTSDFNYETITECRRACGGLGYSFYNGFGKYLGVQDVHCTWEGDNNILIQQCAKTLLKNLKFLHDGKPVYKTCEFMTAEKPQFDENSYFKGSFKNYFEVAALFMTRANYKVHDCGMKLMSAMENIEETWNQLQPYHMIPMCKAYYDIFNIQTCMAAINTQFARSPETFAVFEKIIMIYMYQKIIDDPEYFLGLDILTKGDFDELKDLVMKLLDQLRPEILALTDMFPHEDENNYGPVGHKDLNVYETFMDRVMANQ